jgi:hypothetical protein
MLNWFIRRQVNEFERRYAYDMSYVRHLLEVSPKAAILFSRATQLGRFCQGVPKDVFFVTQLCGVLHEDCGPCVQLGVDIAEQAGVAPTTLRALVAGNLHELPEDCRLAAAFAQAVLSRDPQADELRSELEAKFGALGVVSLAFALTCARIYPTMKYALGFGKACTRVRVGGAPVDRAHAEPGLGATPNAA